MLCNLANRNKHNLRYSNMFDHVAKSAKTKEMEQ